MSLHYSDILASERQLVEPSVSGAYETGYKRVFDVVFVCIVSVFAIPVLGIVCLAIMSAGHTPFFRQVRVGKGGKRFSMWKLRTMVPDADRALALHLACTPTARLEWEANQKLQNDPRVTGIGRLLRRTSIDELPQLYNVLAGHMSLVGPRPMMPCQEPLYPGRAYFQVRPGVTGSWQVGRRHTTTFAERADFDDAYVANINFMTDTRILLRTVGAVLRCKGA